jgi:hypothetical protein
MTEREGFSASTSITSKLAEGASFGLSPTRRFVAVVQDQPTLAHRRRPAGLVAIFSALYRSLSIVAVR